MVSRKKKRKRERQDRVEKHHWCSRNETKCIPRVKKWRGTIALRWKTFVSEILLTHSKGDWKWRTVDDKRLAYIHHTAFYNDNRGRDVSLSRQGFRFHAISRTFRYETTSDNRPRIVLNAIERIVVEIDSVFHTNEVVCLICTDCYCEIEYRKWNKNIMVK